MADIPIVYDAFSTARVHEIEQEAMVNGPLQRAAILCLVDAGRKLRAAAQALLAHETDYRDGWIERQYLDAFRDAVLTAYEDGAAALWPESTTAP